MLKSFIEKIHRLNNDLLLLIVTQFHTTQKGYQRFLDLTPSLFKPLINSSRFTQIYQSKINDHFTIETVTKENGWIKHRYRLNEQLHREYDQPAWIGYDDVSGNMRLQYWYKDGLRHRDGDQPAVIWYNSQTGDVRYQVWYKDGNLHRDKDQPAWIWYDGVSGNVIRKAWFKDGNLHRDVDDQPAYIEYNGQTGNITHQYWYKDGKHIK